MKEKIIKGISILIAFTAIFGLSLSIQKSYATPANRLSEGQRDLDSYPYNVHPGSFEEKSTSNPWKLLEHAGYQIYCIQPNSPINFTWHKEMAAMRAHEGHKIEGSHLWGCGGGYHKQQCDWTYGWDWNDGHGTVAGVLSPLQVSEESTSELTDYLAYVISEDPVGQWSEDKQLCVWNSRDLTANARDGTPLDLDGGIIVGSGASTHQGHPAIEQEAINYAIYAYDVKKTGTDVTGIGVVKNEEGINPVDAMSGQGTVQFLDSTKEYSVKYFSVNWVDGDFGDIAFGGISDMYVVGHNAKGELIMDGSEPKKYPIKELHVYDTNKNYKETILASEIHYFTPEEENSPTGQKTDHEKQKYPGPDELFEVIVDDPNIGVDANDTDNRVVMFTVKVKFKYMKAKGQYTKLHVEKYNIYDDHSQCSGANCSHYHSHGRYSGHNASCVSHCVRICRLNKFDQQYHGVFDAIRSIYEDEIDLVAGDEYRPKDPNDLEIIFTDNTMQLGGRVWLDMQIDKEGQGWNGIFDGDPTINAITTITDDSVEFGQDKDTWLKGVEVQLYEQVNGTLNPDPIGYTVTDEEGKYCFYGLDSGRKYTVKFVYNGLMFQGSLFTGAQEGTLRGGKNNLSEQKADRDAFNERFAEIGTYPSNYVVAEQLFKSPGDYNQSWAIEDLCKSDASGNPSLYDQWIDKAVEIVHEHLDSEKKYIQVDDSGNLINPFKQAAEELGTSDELKSQLQFLMDSRMEAWSGNNGNADNPGNLFYYPYVPAGFDGITPRAREEADDPSTGTFYAKGGGKKTIAIYDGVDIEEDPPQEMVLGIIPLPGGGKLTIKAKYIRRTYKDNRAKEAQIDSVLRIDGAVTWRNNFDMSLRKDLYKATLKINGKTQVYTYNSRNLSSDEANLAGNKSESVNGKTKKGTAWDIQIQNDDSGKGRQDTYNEKPVTQRTRRDVYKSDYYYKSSDYYTPSGFNDPAISNTDPSGNTDSGGAISTAVADINKGTELEAYVTYKIAVRNQSQAILGTVTEIVDYYDDTYIYEPNLSFATYVTETANDGTPKDTEDSGDPLEGVSAAQIFAENKVKATEFQKGMEQKFTPLEGDNNKKTTYASGSGTIRDYITSAKEIQADESTSIYSNRPNGQKDFSNFKELYVTGLENKKLSPGETLYLYLTYRVQRKAGSNGLLGELDFGGEPGSEKNKYNTAEINGYKTFYMNDTEIPCYDGQNNYKVSGEDKVAGLVDRDSTPGNLTQDDIQGAITESGDLDLSKYEDDSDTAPGIKLVVNEGFVRVLNGEVWDDKREEFSGEATIGNGKKDTGEKNVAGVNVQMIEITQEDTSSTEFYQTLWQEMKTGADGKYKFEGYIPGNYFIKFIYGDGRETVLAAKYYDNENVEKDNEVTAAVGGTALNDKSYNGHDYKSTNYQEGTNQADYKMPTPFILGGEEVKGYTDYSAEGGNGTYKGPQSEVATFIYDIEAGDTNKDISDAKDLGTMRDKVVAYSKDQVTNHKAEVLASPYTLPKYLNPNEAIDTDDPRNGEVPYTAAEQNALLDELQTNTQMNAVSGVIDMEVEYNRKYSHMNNDGDGSGGDNTKNGNYELVGLDFGMTQRPQAQLVINQKVYEIDVKDQTGKALFNSQNLSPVANLTWLANDKLGLNDAIKDPEDKKILTKWNLMQKGLLNPVTDEEEMKGMVVRLTYEITIDNKGEVDYTEAEFYYTGKNGNEKSKTRLDQLIDYIDVNIQYIQNVDGGINDIWKIVEANGTSGEDQTNYTNSLITTGLLNEKLTGFVDNDFAQIIKLKDARAESVPGDTDSFRLQLSQTITAEDLDALRDASGNFIENDKLIFDNVVEIVTTSNTLGRRMAFSSVGNQEPLYNGGVLKEIDAAQAEETNVFGPTGTRRPVIYAVLGIVICTIIIAGVIFIKKKILK